MYSTMIVASIVPFRGSDTPDKNGLPSVFLRLIAGSMPNRQTITGTVAENIGLEIGKTYLLQMLETGTHIVHGKQFSFAKVGEVNGKEVIELLEKLGKPEVFSLDKPEASKDYQRITNSIEGFNTKEAKAGNFIPVTSFNRNHFNTDVKEGSSNQGESVDRTKELDNLTNKETEKNLPDSLKKDNHNKAA